MARRIRNKRALMNLRLLLCAVLTGAGIGWAAESGLGGLEPIGDVSVVTPVENGVVLTCADHSEVRITVLAPDLVRVRAAFRGPLATPDHSWAIAKAEWRKPSWQFHETAAEVRLTTDEFDVVVHRAPLRIEFRDLNTGRPINADLRPMSRDPNTGAISATKRLGLDERFYGLGEKAARHGPDLPEHPVLSGLGAWRDVRRVFRQQLPEQF